MRFWVFLLAVVAIVAGGALAVRHYGIDLAALPGLQKVMATSQTPQRQGGQSQARGPAPVETARAVASRLSDDISAIGTLLAEESVAIAPETSGRVAKVLFADGQAVEKGTPLFQFDTDLASSDLAEARARLRLAEANYERQQKLRQTGNVAQSAYEEALSARDVARAAVDSAQVRLDKLTISAPSPARWGSAAVPKAPM